MTDVRRPGRPRLDETDASAKVHLTLPAREYDALYAAAQRERVSVPEKIRRDLRRARHVLEGREEE